MKNSKNIQLMNPLGKFTPNKVAINFMLFVFIIAFSFNARAQESVINGFKESYALETKGDFTGAIEKIKAVYQIDAYEMNLRLGWLHYQSGLLAESGEYYAKAVSLKPYAIEPKLGWVLPLSAQGKWDEVIGLYQKILQVDPQNSMVNYRLGLIYYNQGNYDSADAYLEKVVNLFPFDYDGLLLLGWNKLNLQKSREAKVLFQKVLMYNPGDESALEGLKLIK